MHDQIVALAKQNKQLTFNDIDPFFGKSDEMQKAFLSKYEPNFPIYGKNRDFLGFWKCKWASEVNGQTHKG